MILNILYLIHILIDDKLNATHARSLSFFLI
jgi:hypothetical protein